MGQTFQELIEPTEIFLERKVEGEQQWCQKFCPDYARQSKQRQARLGNTQHINEVFVTIQGQRQYPWSAVDQDGDVIARRVHPVLFAARSIDNTLINPIWLVAKAD
jgi:transposase-like protein